MEIPVLMIDGRKAAKYRIGGGRVEEDAGGRGRIGGIGRTALPTPPFLPVPPLLPYFAVMMKCPRRFCCQQSSFASLQNGCSFPLLTTVT